MQFAKSVLVLAALALLLLVPVAAAEDAKMKVISTYDFSDQATLDQLNYMLLDLANGKLLSWSSEKGEIRLAGYLELKDVASDNVVPVLVLDIDAPSMDLNSGEKIVYAYILGDVYELAIGVADVNGTTVENLTFLKISPYASEIAVVRTGSDIVITTGRFKYIVPLAGYADPKLLLFAGDGSAAQISRLAYVELRALRNPPAGYTLVRSGSGEAVFTISVSGRVSVWFDETHEGGDVDLFIYDSRNPHYSEASTQQSWSWHMRHASRYIWADAYPQAREVDAHGSLKFVVKEFRNANAVQWRVAVRLLSGSGGGPQPQPQPIQPPIQPQPTQPIQPQPIQPQTVTQTVTATQTLPIPLPIGGNDSNMGALILLGLLFLVILIAVARR